MATMRMQVLLINTHIHATHKQFVFACGGYLDGCSKGAKPINWYWSWICGRGCFELAHSIVFLPTEALDIKLGEIPAWLQQRYKSKWKKTPQTKEEKEDKQQKKKREKDEKKRKYMSDAKEGLLDVVKQCPAQDIPKSGSSPSHQIHINQYMANHN